MESQGIVLWSDAPSGGMIIWCADSGELAFANGEVANNLDACEVGDLVDLEFESHHPGERLCSQVVRKTKNAAPELVQILKQQAGAFTGGTQTTSLTTRPMQGSPSLCLASGR